MLRLNLMTGLAVSALFAAGFPATARAGFEWVTPPAPAAAPATETLTPAMPAIPRDHVEVLDTQQVPVAPVIAEPVPAPVIQDAPGMIMPPNSLSSAPSDVGGEALPSRRRPPLSEKQQSMMDPVPAATISAPVLSEPVAEPVVAATISAPAPAAYAEAVGFGSDIPLALAMRQIVPPEFAFSFDPSINQGTRVTWNGGRPWNAVLSDAVAPLDAGVVVDGKTVRVVPRGNVPAVLPERDVAGLSAPATPMMTDPAADISAAQSSEVYVRRDPDAGTFWSSLKFWEEQEPVESRKEYVVRDPAPLNHAPTPIVPVETRADVSVDQPVASVEPVTLTRAPGTVSERDVISPVVPGANITFWQAERGDSLKNVLQSWADEAGVKLYWVSAQDYNLPAAIRVEGDFTDAVSKALSSFGDTGARPAGRLHPNLPAGPAVLIVEPVAG